MVFGRMMMLKLFVISPSLRNDFFNIYNMLFMRDMYVKILFVILLYVWHTIKVFINLIS